MDDELFPLTKTIILENNSTIHDATFSDRFQKKIAVRRRSVRGGGFQNYEHGISWKTRHFLLITWSKKTFGSKNFITFRDENSSKSKI